MANKIITIILLSLAFSAKGQTKIEVWDNTKIYMNPDVNSKVLSTVEKSEIITTTVVKSIPHDYDTYFKVNYKGVEGWIYNTSIIYNDYYYSTLDKLKPLVPVKSLNNINSDTKLNMDSNHPLQDK